MYIWPALLVAPLLVLVNLDLAHAVAGACEDGVDAAHGLVLLCFAAVAAFTVLAWRETRRLEGAALLHDRHFLAVLATEAGALSFLAMGAIWIPRWALGCS